MNDIHANIHALERETKFVVAEINDINAEIQKIEKAMTAHVESGQCQLFNGKEYGATITDEVHQTSSPDSPEIIFIEKSQKPTAQMKTADESWRPNECWR
uniref:Uncharacterized protein n=1 Tax=Panagrolaimus superbus TaxID=310955 RepID=A0A914YKV3_9BILA